MLQYKGDDAGCMVRLVNEGYSTQECSVCHRRTGPKGLEGLSVRRWTCSVCQTEHDRDATQLEISNCVDSLCCRWNSPLQGRRKPLKLQ